MFYALRKLITLAACAFWGMTCQYLYHHPDAVPTFGGNYVNRKEQERIKLEDAHKYQGNLYGTVVSVLDARALEIEDSANRRFSIALAGLFVPVWHEMPGRGNLTDSVKGQRVKVSIVSMTTPESGLGVVYVGNDCLNVEQVRSGEAGIHVLASERLPSQLRDELAKASLQSRAAKAGMWQPPE